jgi:hypothetical protein
MISIPISIVKCIIICSLTATLVQLTSCTVNRSKLYSANSLPTVFSKPTLQTPNIPCSKSHFHFPLPREFQRIHQSLMSCLLKLFFYSKYC